MINGVFLIVAAVLFAVVHLFGGLGVMWLWIAGVYLAAGVVDLAVYYVKNRSRIHAANKKAAKSEKKAEENAKQAEEAKKQMEAVKLQEKTVNLPEAVEEK